MDTATRASWCQLRFRLRCVFAAIITVFGLVPTCVAKEFRIDSLGAFKLANKNAEPGDTLVLDSRKWTDTAFVFTAKGSHEFPITLRGEEAGKTVLTGSSTLRIGGEYLVVSGLRFHNTETSTSDLIQFRKDSKTLARHCRITDCSVTSDFRSSDSSDGEKSRWVGLYGEANRVDHCVFQGKTDEGATLVVWLGSGSIGGHRIDHNYFGPRQRLGKNGGETIRIGDSKTSMLNGDCLVERNLFEHCNGEAECVSNKSCNNTYRENTFLEVAGTLTLRHGNSCWVHHNIFLGNGVKETGGIRIIGEDHVVENNYLSRLTGDEARSAISLMMGIPNSPLNRYFQVKGVRVRGNVIVDCKHSFLIGLSDDENATLPPVESSIIDNQVRSLKYPAVEARCDLNGIQWSGNRFHSKTLGIPRVDGIDATLTLLIQDAVPIARNEVGTTW